MKQLCAFLVFVLAMLCCAAQAGMLLKPTGGQAMPLRVKALTARAEIHGQFAVTTLKYAFLNESSDRLEADFIYSMPPGAVATCFAYWFGEEKVVARIVEKERAAQIYQHITSRMRDPALVEMIGKNTFRARIFPVMPHADLKVEIVMAQALPTDHGDILYTLPLQEANDPITYEQLDVRVTPFMDATITEVANNYGLEPQQEGAASMFSLIGANYRPPRDLRIRLKRAPASLQASLYSARSGGPDGFFALALTPDHSLRRPRIRISGISTYAAAPAKLPDVKAGQAVILTGRYRGSGKATVMLTGQLAGKPVSYSGTVTFADQAEPNNLATKLWAAERMDDLDESAKSRETVLAMSHRYNLPGKFTSWLAIPIEELQRYKEEKLWADLQTTITALENRIIAGTENSAEGKRLHARLTDLCAQLKRNPQQMLADYLSDDLINMASKLAKYTEEGKGEKAARLRAAIERICELTGKAPELIIKNGRESYRLNKLYLQVEETAEQLAAYYIAGTEESAKARQLQTRLEQLCKVTGNNPQQVLGSHLYDATCKLTERLAPYIAAGTEQQAEAVRLRARLDTLNKIRGDQSDWILENALGNLLGRDVDRYARLFIAHKENGAEAASLRRRVERLAKARGSEPTRTINEALDNYAYDIGKELAIETHSANPDHARIQRLEAELQRVGKATGSSMDEIRKGAEQNWAYHEVERVRDQLYTEVSRTSPDPARVKRLEERFRMCSRLAHGSDNSNDTRLERIKVNAELERVERQLRQGGDSVDLNALHTRLTELKKSAEELRARMGDPLISVEAPADARQVIALLPHGEIKKMEYNTGAQRWEARFDIPAYTPSGAYVITIIIVRRDGTRSLVKFTYHVDLTPPSGEGRAQVVSDLLPVLRLAVDASPDTARVMALLPWGARAELAPASTPDRFFALVPIPDGQQVDAQAVTFVLTDKAHNRISYTVDMRQAP
ncbi:MAG: VIT domain-containing protein [Armatimonadota bacterium]